MGIFGGGRIGRLLVLVGCSGINGVAMNVLELARRILIASVNRETTGKYCTHLFVNHKTLTSFWMKSTSWRFLDGCAI